MEFGVDSILIRDYAQKAEALGYNHISAYDHILGANPNRPGWKGLFGNEASFLEPFTLFSYMSSLTSKINFNTRILILPQRQTALVAKQAATLDVLCQGRFRLGVGLGWNEVEYIAQNENFNTRGRRLEEQIEVLREFWTQPLLEYKGSWHNIPDAGLNPLPIQRPIPVWLGGHAQTTLKRVARLGDGWMPNDLNFDETMILINKLADYAHKVGRPFSSIGIDPRQPYIKSPELLLRAIEDWRRSGVTHLTLDTMGCGFETPDAHLTALSKAAEVIGLPSK